MRQKKLPYHKGNLREKLLREAARIIAQSGVKSLSMRRLNARLGTSRMAAYHHFASKDDLLMALGQEGFQRLTNRLQAARQMAPAPRERLEAALLAYVRFAQEETEFFRLMFSRVLKRPVQASLNGELSAYAFSSPQALAAFQTLLAGIKECQAAGVIHSRNPLLLANMLWAFTHGIACLAIDQHLKLTVSIEEYLKQSLVVLFAGIGQHEGGKENVLSPVPDPSN